MKTIEEQIEVMTAFMSGAKVEYKELYLNEQYKTIENENMTLWNWSDYDYRIKEQKKLLLLKSGYVKMVMILIMLGSVVILKVMKKNKLLETYEVEL